MKFGVGYNYKHQLVTVLYVHLVFGMYSSTH